MRDQILEVAFGQYAKHGIHQINNGEITNHLGISKEELTLLFPTKEELVVATAQWKMNEIGRSIDKVVALKVPIVEKLHKYLQAAYQHTKDASFTLITDFFKWQAYFRTVMNGYLKEAVYSRIAKLLSQAEVEGALKNEISTGDAMYKYWDMLSALLAINMSDKLPLEVVRDQPMSMTLCTEIFRFYKEVLDDQSVRKLEKLIADDPLLKGI